VVGGFHEAVRRQWVVQQPEPLARCVWRSTPVVLGGAENQDAPRAGSERF